MMNAIPTPLFNVLDVSDDTVDAAVDTVVVGLISVKMTRST